MLNNALRILEVEIFSISYFFFYYLPGYHLSNKLRGYFVKLFFEKIGGNFILNREVIIECPKNIIVGDNVGVNARCWISGGGGIKIGNNVLIGPGVKIITSNHNYSDTTRPLRNQGDEFKPVSIGDDSWIGAGVIILPGVHVGNNIVVGAGSVVTKSLDCSGVYVGNPARKIKGL